MTATTENQIARHRNRGSLGAGKAADEKLLAGTMCFYVAATGFISGDDAAGANAFAGIVKDEVDNSAGSAGDLDVEFWQSGEFELIGSSFVQADAGDAIYAVDNWTIQKSSTSATYVGHCTEFVSATKLMVDIHPGPVV